MRGGTFNLLYGRDTKKVREEVIRAVTEYNLDYLGVQESTDYRLILHDIPGYTYYSGGSVNGGAQTEIGLLVRSEHEVTHVKNQAYGDGWFGTASKTRMLPRNLLVATINRKHKVGVIHNPPNVDIPNQTPVDRYLDLKALALRVRGFFSGPSLKTRLIMGDWNVEPYVRAKFSPRWIAYSTGSTLSSPDDRIDYILTKGLNVVSIKKVHNLRERSDHELVVFVTKPKYRRKAKDD